MARGHPDTAAGGREADVVHEERRARRVRKQPRSHPDLRCRRRRAPRRTSRARSTAAGRPGRRSRAARAPRPHTRRTMRPRRRSTTASSPLPESVTNAWPAAKTRVARLLEPPQHPAQRCAGGRPSSNLTAPAALCPAIATPPGPACILRGPSIVGTRRTTRRPPSETDSDVRLRCRRSRARAARAPPRPAAARTPGKAPRRPGRRRRTGGGSSTSLRAAPGERSLSRLPTRRATPAPRARICVDDEQRDRPVDHAVVRGVQQQ